MPAEKQRFFRKPPWMLKRPFVLGPEQKIEKTPQQERGMRPPVEKLSLSPAALAVLKRRKPV